MSVSAGWKFVVGVHPFGDPGGRQSYVLFPKLWGSSSVHGCCELCMWGRCCVFG